VSFFPREQISVNLNLSVPQMRYLAYKLMLWIFSMCSSVSESNLSAFQSADKTQRSQTWCYDNSRQ